MDKFSFRDVRPTQLNYCVPGSATTRSGWVCLVHEGLGFSLFHGKTLCPRWLLQMCTQRIRPKYSCFFRETMLSDAWDTLN